MAETFRNRPKGLPTMRGNGIMQAYRCSKSLTTDGRLRAAPQAPGETIPWGTVTL